MFYRLEENHKQELYQDFQLRLKEFFVVFKLAVDRVGANQLHRFVGRIASVEHLENAFGEQGRPCGKRQCGIFFACLLTAGSGQLLGI